MQVFLATLNQMGFLFSMLLIGFILVRLRVVDDRSCGVLSKLESSVFIPALVMGTFIEQFTVEKLRASRWLLLASIAVLAVTVPLAILFSRLIAPKDAYLRNICRYSLCFPNFGFVGNAVVGALFPEFFVDYLIFTLPFWALIYIWGVPYLLLGDGEKPKSVGQLFKPFLNPMFICMFIGIAIGLTGLVLPPFASTLITTCGSCMSPIAMLLTGMVVASIDLGKVLRRKSIYIASLLRLLVIPLLALGVLLLVRLPDNIAVCAVCIVTMPLGLNPVVIPGGFGKDVSDAAGMALVSHFAACGTIPLIFMLLQMILHI